MKDWKNVGLAVFASIAIGTFATAGGRSAIPTSREASRVQAARTVEVTRVDRVATSDAERDNGPGCAESALSR